MNTKIIISAISLIFISLNVFSQKSVSNYQYVSGYNEYDAKEYFNTHVIDPIEGLWQSSDGFKYSIEKDVENDTRSSSKYRVIILTNNSSFAFWKPTYIKAIIEHTAADNVYNMEYYTNSSEGDNLSVQSILGVLEGGVLFSFNVIKNRYSGYSEKVTFVKLYPKSR